ncbi:hypothetical protein EV127DRAFT_482284 [Xylaria flabelliformis]|nr:hypothetical protein EV127DRAFT_482284 [Xylaria flabelliformis]
MSCKKTLGIAIIFFPANMHLNKAIVCLAIAMGAAAAPLGQSSVPGLVIARHGDQDEVYQTKRGGDQDEVYQTKRSGDQDEVYQTKRSGDQDEVYQT